MENLGKHRQNTNIIQEMEERISGIEDMIEEMDTLVKENVKSRKFLTQNIQEIWNTIVERLPMLKDQ